MTGTWLSGEVRNIDQEIEGNISTILTSNIRTLFNQSNHGVQAEDIEYQGSRKEC